MSSTDVSRLEVALAMHTLKPYDSQAVRKRVRRIVRHKGFNAVTLVCSRNLRKQIYNQECRKKNLVFFSTTMSPFLRWIHR